MLSKVHLTLGIWLQPNCPNLTHRKTLQVGADTLFTQKDSKDADEAKVEEDEDGAEKKRLLLQQHQYEEDSDDVVERKNVARDESSGVAPVEKLVEELRLEKLERQIQVEQGLNDDAANYMRGEYEIADLKRQHPR